MPFARLSRASRERCEGRPSTILAGTGFSDMASNEGSRSSPKPRRIPPELQASQPNIPWTQIMGMGNVLRHEYHRVSDTLTWNVVQEYLPPLRVAITTIESDLKK
jgi:hypothetical protein